MSSVSPVDSAIMALDHVWTSTIQDFSYSSHQPCQRTWSLVFWERTVLVHWLWALVYPLLCVPCQTVPSVCFEFWLVSDGSDVCWSILRVLKGLLLGLGIHEEFQLEKEDMPRWGCLITEVVLWLEHREIHPFSCRHSSPSSPWPWWSHLTGGYWGDHVVCTKLNSWCKPSKFFSIEWRVIVGHHNGGYTFSCEKFTEMVDGLEMMCRCHSEGIWELAEVICND